MLEKLFKLRENDTTVKEIQFKENTGFSSSPNSIFNSARQESTV